MNLDPSVLGWHEFWLRILVLAFVAGLLITIGLIVGKVLLTIADLLRWAARKINGKREEA